MDTTAPSGDFFAELFDTLLANPMVQTALTVVGALYLALYLIAAIGAGRDIAERTGSRRMGLLAGCFVLAATPLAFPVALLLVRALRPADASRDRETTALETRVMAAEAAGIVDCPSCAAPLPAEWLACPADGSLVRARCATCKTPIALTARACPFCGAGAVEAAG